MEQTIGMIAEATGLSYKSVRRALEHLEALGLVRKGRRVANTNTYIFNVEFLNPLLKAARDLVYKLRSLRRWSFQLNKPLFPSPQRVIDMEIEVVIYFTLREKLGWSSRRLRLPGRRARLRDVLEAVPELWEILVRGGELNPDFRVLIDGRNVVFLGGLNAEVRDGSRIVVFPPAGGG